MNTMNEEIKNISEQMDFPVVTLNIPDGVASFKGQFTDSEGNVWEVELFKYKIDSDDKGKFLEIHNETIPNITRMYYQAIDKKLLENMPDDILNDLKDKIDGEITNRKYKNIPKHQHTHSLYVHCLNCRSFGVPEESNFTEAVQCGNCGSMETVKYYPACCILVNRQEAYDEGFKSGLDSEV